MKCATEPIMMLSPIHRSRCISFLSHDNGAIQESECKTTGHQQKKVTFMGRTCKQESFLFVNSLSLIYSLLVRKYFILQFFFPIAPTLQEGHLLERGSLGMNLKARALALGLNL